MLEQIYSQSLTYLGSAMVQKEMLLQEEISYVA